MQYITDWIRPHVKEREGIHMNDDRVAWDGSVSMSDREMYIAAAVALAHKKIEREKERENGGEKSLST